MNFFSRNWKAFLGLILFLAGVLVLVLILLPAKQSYEATQARLNMQIQMSNDNIAENQQIINLNKPYEDVQDDLVVEHDKLLASRESLYAHFSAELREEDVLLFMLGLETHFGDTVKLELLRYEELSGAQSNFGNIVDVARLSDGSMLRAWQIELKYSEATYQGFREMIDYLARDPNILSVNQATMYYNEFNQVNGRIVIVRYMIVPSGYNSSSDYTEPEVETEDEVGKDDIFH